MKNKILISFLLCAVLFIFGWALGSKTGASNFDRLVLGTANYGTDPNTTADITFQNGGYISNYTNGSIDFGSANVITTGTINGKWIGGGWGQFKAITNSANNQNKYDTLTITGVDTSYRFTATPFKAGLPVAGDLLACNVITNKLIVERADTTTANLRYAYNRVE